MAKNFVQEGQTISITNTGQAVIESGDPVVLGSLVAVSLVDIAPNETGEGMAEGVFLLPKVSADVIPAGTKVYIADGEIQLASADAVAAGIAWEAAAAGSTVVEVKING
ncbi:DUF2190 family protein [Rahnella victoriana]|uniref:DUF2190 family protein n=1 Tax=Rahnella victoriana TaxID=1510570 RepID=UPI00103F3D2F|nr:capsid cement protein [Rahnella victoriana]TBX35836.1 DUF2190 family protein [Rahnella victoriana]